VCYKNTPPIGIFMKEWLNLYNSKSGERGIFSRDASVRQAKKNGRRKTKYDFGTNPCSEIILRPYQFCNLTEVVVREDDTIKTLEDKVQDATILGTFQSTLTNFKYLRKVWQNNTEEERLLGVSMTGILDNPKLGKAQDLQQLRQVAIDTNSALSEQLGIPQSTSITCVKPSGTVSQLVNSASGIHARHSAYYVRTVRGDKKDPLTKFMTDQGIPCEDDLMQPDSTVVFSFPMKSPNKATLRSDIDAVTQLETWKTYQENWCEHKPSVTISVKEDEWFDVGAWVFNNFKDLAGVSFLPHSEHTYKQAPYQEISYKEYIELSKKMPKNVDWTLLSNYEKEDNTTGMQELACTADACEVVDIT